MRSFSILSALVVLAWVLSATDASAQRDAATATTLRATSAPAQRFRARSASERLAAARDLTQGMRVTINEEYFNTPFSLTPRAPDVPGRGWLDARNIGYWYAHVPAEHASAPWAGPDGAILLSSTLGEAYVHLTGAAGHRFMVDCTVHGAIQVRARTASGATTTINAQNGAMLSVVTAPGEDLVTVSASGGLWRLLGCEITRLQ
ncbi:MAG: hypothetical protein ABL871_11270 [Terricaulis sp.]